MSLESNRLPTLSVHIEFAVQHEEKFVLVVVLMPGELALEYPETNDRVVHRRQCLIEPGLTRCHLVRNVDDGQLSVSVLC